MVIERLTIERFPKDDQATALEAVAGRVDEPGIFLSCCLDDNFPPDWGWAQHESGLFHASESWFRENGWPIWDNTAITKLTGRVAWLIRIGSMKARPRSGN